MPVKITLTNDFSSPFDKSGFDIDFMSGSQPATGLPSSYQVSTVDGFAKIGPKIVDYYAFSGPGFEFSGAVPTTVDGEPYTPGSEYAEDYTTTLHLDQGTFTQITRLYGPKTETIEFDGPTADVVGRTLGSLISDEAIVHGSGAADSLAMTDFAEAVYGGDGRDKILGRGGDDLLFGGDAKDVIDGGAGDDEIYGGSGHKDRLIGGPGNDFLADGRVYIFDAALGPDNVDHIDSYYAQKELGGGDRIRLDSDIFSALEPGKLKSKYFDKGNRRPDDKDDFIVYHKKSGKLFYDPDGSRGKHDKELFAILDNQPGKLSHKDFILFDDG